MVNAAVTDARDAERALAIGYAPAAARGALATLIAVDRRLGELIAGNREPIVAQMRLTWWHEALTGLDRAAPPAEPLLQAVAEDLIPRGVSGQQLATMTDGWERLLAEPIDLFAFAKERGGRLFTLGARLLGADDVAVDAAGQGWALADLARRSGDAAIADEAAAMARLLLDRGLRRWWPRALRPLGALALSARADLVGQSPGSPQRVARLLLHRLTGR